VTASPEAEIEQRVRQSGLLAAEHPVVVLLSGGRDSTCLLDLAVAIAGRESVIIKEHERVNLGGTDVDRLHPGDITCRTEPRATAHVSAHVRPRSLSPRAPKSGLPDFGIYSGPKSGKPDFG